MKTARLSERSRNVKDSEECLVTAKRVLWTEGKALLEFAEMLGDSFVQAIDIVTAAEGRVIVSGIGKSGHVGRKIAATLASTGTPAFFVHPAEASHGDMGMIVRGDVVLALSNSGESRELLDLIEYTRRFAIPLIGITGNEASTLGTRADVALLLPPFPEACPNVLAPTTSTTLTLALGDALAIALLEKKGFTARDFHVFHPGGKLGQRLMRAAEIMHGGDSLPVAPETVGMEEAIAIISEKTFGCIALTDAAGNLSGIITDGDIRRQVSADLPKKKAFEVMTRNPRTVSPDTLVAEAMAIMNGLHGARKITGLIVVEEGKPVGLLHIHDCLRAGFA
jgi:arabinose-5-phosphate isomerase